MKYDYKESTGWCRVQPTYAENVLPLLWLSLPKIKSELVQNRTQTSVMRGRRLDPSVYILSEKFCSYITRIYLMDSIQQGIGLQFIILLLIFHSIQFKSLNGISASRNETVNCQNTIKNINHSYSGHSLRRV